MAGKQSLHKVGRDFAEVCSSHSWRGETVGDKLPSYMLKGRPVLSFFFLAQLGRTRLTEKGMVRWNEAKAWTFRQSSACPCWKWWGCVFSREQVCVWIMTVIKKWQVHRGYESTTSAEALPAPTKAWKLEWSDISLFDIWAFYMIDPQNHVATEMCFLFSHKYSKFIITSLFCCIRLYSLLPPRLL